jgi:hypothetical protein
MRTLRSVLFIVLVGSLTTGCAPRPITTAGGVAPRGTYVFSGIVDGDVVNGTLQFTDPIVLAGSHGRCTRKIEGIHRWGGPFGVTCPGFSLRVRVNDDGGLQRRGTARLRKPGWREEPVSCRTYSADGKSCLVWNTALVEYDRWVEGRVEVKRGGS